MCSRPKPSNCSTETKKEAISTGTKVTFKPDAEIFETVVFDYEISKSRFKELAFFAEPIAGVKITNKRQIQVIAHTFTIYHTTTFIRVIQGILFQKMLISDSEITLKTIIQENIAFKETYFVNNGYLDTHLRSYIPMPEEYGSSREMYLELAGVKEICTDLDMFKDMMNDRLIIGKVNDLSNYGLYFPQMKVLKKK